MGFELDKKTDQIVARLYSRPLYQTLIQGRSTYLKRILIPLQMREKDHITLFGNNINKLEKKPADIVPS